MFCVSDSVLQLFLKHLNLSLNIHLYILYKKGLQTAANTHQFNSVTSMDTLKTILLGSSVFVLEPDISQYSLYSHSLWNIKMQVVEEMCFYISDCKHRFNSLSWTNTQQSSLKDTFVLCFSCSLTAIYLMLEYGWKFSVFRFFRQRVYKLLQTHISLTP